MNARLFFKGDLSPKKDSTGSTTTVVYFDKQDEYCLSQDTHKRCLLANVLYLLNKNSLLSLS